ncbi:MAG: ketoacyl-ACP synthase III [Saprospiraceae bacterium]|nr:ketoacyl-ACP synthase III [Saprospiraceae bacterium]
MAEARITAIGMAVPETKITNRYFENIVDTTEDWIVSRTGIQERYHARPDEFSSDLAVRAVEDMIRRYGVSVRDVDLVIVSTVTPDQPMPSVACRLQHRLNMGPAGAFDVYAACAGMMYAINIAKGMIAAGSHQKVLVVGSETLSKVTDFTDRTSCVLFGDGAGAMLFEAAEKGNVGKGITGADGSGGADLYISGYADDIDGHPVVHNRKIVQNGRKVFKWAVNTMSEMFEKLLVLNDMKKEDLSWFVPHSANMRILEAICAETGFPMERTLESLVNFGNTSSASIPLAICQALDQSRIKSGDTLLLLGFGGGLTYSGTLIRWM